MKSSKELAKQWLDREVVCPENTTVKLTNFLDDVLYEQYLENRRSFTEIILKVLSQSPMDKYGGVYLSEDDIRLAISQEGTK
jgi:transposase